MASSTPSSTWVDNLQMKPITKSPSSTFISSTTNAFEFNIASFNILAESYISPRSHPNLPAPHAAVAFDKNKRRALLIDTLRHFCDPSSSFANKWDILALQELDLLADDEGVLPALKSWGYDIVHTPTVDRKDCCAIVFDKAKFRVVKWEVVKFDDLATLCVKNKTASGENKANHDVPNNTNGCTKSNNYNIKSELTGMVRSFLRRNCAILAHLETITNDSNSISGGSPKQSLVVASVHLYWNPGYEYVKLCQAKYLVDRAYAMASSPSNSDSSGMNHKVIPTVICGDMNSKPHSIVHQFFVRGEVDGRSVAPWCYFWDVDQEEMYTEDADDNEKGEKEGYPLLDGNDDVNFKNEWRSHHYGKKLKKRDSVKSSSRTAVGGYRMIGFGEEYSQCCQFIPFDMTNKSRSSGKQRSIIAIEEKKEDIKATHNADQDISDLSNQFNLCQFIDSSVNDDATATLVDSTQVDNTTTNNKEQDTTNDTCNEPGAILASRRMSNHKSPQDYIHETPVPTVKYMLDFTLNRFTRWLRILGIDARLETDDEERERTKGQRIAIFEHCKREKRTLLTTSYKLLLRKDCPPGAYLLDPKSITHLEQALPRLLRTHGVKLSPCTFLTRCVVCNGIINRVTTNDEKQCVFIEHGATELVHSTEEIEVFRCDGCNQGYWWDDRPTSSASRVFAQATKLFRLCLRGGVRIMSDAFLDKETMRKEVMGAFDFVNVAKERNQGIHVGQDLAAIDWLGEENLSNPYRLRSAYYVDTHANDTTSEFPGESLHFSNVTSEFVGLLDYIFFDKEEFEQVGRLNIPTSFRDMNPSSLPKGHLIPSDVWPSDHLAVGARLRLRSSKASSASQINHPLRCSCGCVPNVLSLFEMAELRKKKREAAKASNQLS